MKHDRVMIIDYGSQYTQLITRRVRELKVYSEIFPFDIDSKEISKFSPKSIILSGGPSSVYSNEAYSLSDSIVDSGHFLVVEEEYSVDKSIYMPTWFEDGKIKIGIQSYLQYALTQEIEHFGINLQGSINNDPFAIVSVVKPDSLTVPPLPLQLFEDRFPDDHKLDTQ